jgi:hypothetical protein
MATAYWIGVTVGLGVAFGLLAAGALAAWRHGLIASVLGALLVGVVAGLLLRGWLGVPGALVGAVVGALSASIIVRGALRRGGTASGTAFIVVAAAIAVGALAFVPFLGYVAAVAMPVIALRRARQEPDRHAGLRTLAK